MRFSVSKSILDSLYNLSRAEWKKSGVKYLGINFTDNLQDLVGINVLPAILEVSLQLLRWNKFQLPWVGCRAVIKMKILPRLLYLFQNLITGIAQKILIRIQQLFTKFIWRYKKPRTGLSTLQMRKESGSLSVPNITRY